MDHPKSKSGGFQVLLAAGIVLVPKCPLCCAAYLGFLSSFGIASFPYSGWLLPGLGSLLLLHLFFLGWTARKRRLYGPFILSFLGTASLLSGKFWLSSGALCWSGVALILLASSWNYVAKKRALTSRGISSFPAAPLAVRGERGL